MKNIAIVLAIVIYSYVILRLFKAWRQMHQEALDIEYKGEKVHIKDPNQFCPICKAWMDLRFTQKIVWVKDKPYVCCVHHSSVELVSFIKNKEREMEKVNE